SNYAAVKAAIMTDDVGSTLRGKILVDMTGMQFKDVRDLVGWSDANGISLLKGSILAYPDDVRAGQCSILYGGARELFEAVAPLLQAMGGHPVHIGDNPADGDKAACAYGCFLYPTVVAFIHGSAFCHRAGISIETYARGLILPLVKGPVLAGMIERLAKASFARRYDEDVQATLNVWNESLAEQIHDVSSERLDPGLLLAAKAL